MSAVWEDIVVLVNNKSLVLVRIRTTSVLTNPAASPILDKLRRTTSPINSITSPLLAKPTLQQDPNIINSFEK